MKKQIFLIFLLALLLRIYGFNWDQGQHLHPDERFLTMVGTEIKWPKSIAEYFDTNKSPLNPQNNKFDFFVYGPLPLFLTKFVAGEINLADYANLNLVGRFLSAFFDIGIVFLLFKISKSIWPSFIYSLMVLPIQLSHFMAVDTFLNFFLVLAFYFAWLSLPVLAGASLGLALSCKITAFLFMPIIILVFMIKNKLLSKKFIVHSLSFMILTFLFFRIFNPYSFTGLARLNPKFLANLDILRSFNNPDVWYPPGVQWIKTKPLIFPFVNIFFWGLGIPLGVISVLAIVKRFKKMKFDYLTVSLFWIIFLFLFQGVQHVKTMRYFLAIYPFIALIAGDWIKTISKVPKFIIFGLLFIYPLAFISIYSRPHTRVSASEWIYKNIPVGSTLSCEHWDDCLPLSLGDKNYSLYKTETLHLYDPDGTTKWQQISEQLAKIDYLILSSNRLWGSISKVPEKYPLTAKFYHDLFAGELGFSKMAEFTSYPIIPDDSAEEAFTVYDHPKVIIFARNQKN